MTKKALASIKPGFSMRHLLCLGWKLVILLSIALCVFAFLRIQQYSQSAATHRRKFRSLTYDFTGNPKIAFLFLVRRNLPLDFLWESFFQNVDETEFSIYIHSEPGFVFNESTTRSAVFFNRQLGNNIKVAWGEASMIQAERILFKEALQNPQLDHNSKHGQSSQSHLEADGIDRWDVCGLALIKKSAMWFAK